MVEYRRKWRGLRNNRIERALTAANLSLTIIFPEDTLVTGMIVGHFFVTDLWLIDTALYLFSMIVISMVFMTFSFVALLGALRCLIECNGGDIPNCLKNCLKATVHSYDHYVKKGVILEQSFTSSSVMFSQADCAICIESFASEEQIAILSCQHVFHTGCIQEWVNHKEEKSILCPVCKHDIREKKDIQPVDETELTEQSQVNPLDDSTANICESRQEHTEDDRHLTTENSLLQLPEKN